MAIERVGDIEIGQDLGFQQRMWSVQRVGWLCMLLIIILGLAGFVGHGPLTGGAAGSPENGLELDYARVARHRSDTQLVFTIHPHAVEDGQVTLGINATYLEGLQILGTIPEEPESVSIDPTWVTYTFAVEDASDPLRIVFDVEPMKNGFRTLEVRVGSAAPLRVRQFVFP